MVDVYLTDIRHLPDPNENPQVCKGLPEQRVQKTLRYRNADDRKRSLAAGLLQRHILQLNGIDEHSVYYSENEKPECNSLCFNLSHSGDYVVCAVSSAAVGCDIEVIKKAAMHVAERFFCASEIAFLQQFTGQEQDDAFFRLWTAKESYMKMTGEGMQLALNRFSVAFSDRLHIYRDGMLQPCCLQEYDLPQYKLTVCATETAFAPQWQEIQFAF